MIRLKTKDDIERLRKSGALLAGVLEEIKQNALPGVSLADLDRIAEEYIKKAGAKPAFLGYVPEGAQEPYPASLCASLNDVVVHGIPSAYTLREGDVLSIDLGVDLEGFITDAAITIGVGKIAKEHQKLITTTERALEAAITVCVPGNHLGDIGFAIENKVRTAGFSVVRGLTGHGVGFNLHEDPVVYNYGTQKTGLELRPGLVLALEPMISTGSGSVEEMKDGSFKTKDGSITAHVEHTVAVTNEGPVVLTKRSGLI